ncbi:unnamed protein product, partial [Arctogadus glacialis]
GPPSTPKQCFGLFEPKQNFSPATPDIHWTPPEKDMALLDGAQVVMDLALHDLALQEQDQALLDRDMVPPDPDT